jgi:hypothetical protein
MTCGGLCHEFPACVPPPSPVILALVARFSAEARAERNSASAIACALSDVSEAITRELDDER